MPYITIKLRASKTNMFQTLGILAPAPVMPAILFVRALDGALRNTLDVQGVGLIHHDAIPWMEYLEEKSKKSGKNKKNPWLKTHVVHRRGAYLISEKEKPGAVPQQPMALADIEWSLLIACRRDPPSPYEIEAVLRDMRFAGGTIDPRHISVQVHDSDDAWDSARQSIRGGRWIEDVSDLMAMAPDPIQAILFPPKDQGWIVPVNLGYALLEAPQTRNGVRQGPGRESLLHAFAENMIGYVRYVSWSRIRDTLTPRALWRYGWDDDQFLVTNRPTVSLSPRRGPARIVSTTVSSTL